MLGNLIRQRLTVVTSGAPKQGALAFQQTDKARAAELFFRFAIGFILSGSKIFGNVAPFAVGFTASAGTSSGCIASLLGSVVGYLLSGPFFWAIKYICIAIIVMATAIVFRDTQIIKSQWFMPAAASLITACVGIMPALAERWTLASTAMLFSDIVLAGGSAYFYKIALSPWSGRFNLEHSAEIIHTVSVLILLSTLLISLAPLLILDTISVGRIAAVLVVFLASFKGGVGMGCATGISIGLAMDAATSASPIFCMAYGLAGMIAGIFSKRNRLIFALTYVLIDSIVAAASISNTAVPAILYEVFIASVIFLILPASFMSRLSVLLPGTGSGYGTIKALEYTKNRVDLTAQAFRDLFETVKSASGHSSNDNDIAAVFDRAADIVCLNCSKTAKCWNLEYQSTVDAMNNVSDAMQHRGSLLESDLPEHFIRSCINVPEFVSAVNTELKALLYRRQYKKRLRENQTAAFNQYADISAILSGISEELVTGTSFEADLEVRLRKYLRSLNIPAETAVFRDRSGRLHAEIFGTSLDTLKKMPDFLEKLSAVFSVRLCLIENTGDPDRIQLLEAEPLSAYVGTACKKKTEKEASGDRGAYFKTDEGMLYVILSDGMGSGDQAARYSGDAVRILERFLRSGVAPETAVRMLNDLMLLKNEDDTGCATVDLVCINLFTGSARMFKYGAAPSYLRNGGMIRRMKGKSMAAGLGLPPHDAPDHLKMDLKAGSLAVIVSDGVAAGNDDKWLCEKISDFDGENPKDLAVSIINQAAEKPDTEDDMTVIVIKVSERV